MEVEKRSNNTVHRQHRLTSRTYNKKACMSAHLDNMTFTLESFKKCFW